MYGPCSGDIGNYTSVICSDKTGRLMENRMTVPIHGTRECYTKHTKTKICLNLSEAEDLTQALHAPVSGEDQINFVSAFSWRKDSNLLLPANSLGVIKVQ
ncbi:hypothetical protein EMCRGX_G029174 [Ephydatia muelleri]